MSMKIYIQNKNELYRDMIININRHSTYKLVLDPSPVTFHDPLFEILHDHDRINCA